MTPYHTVEYDPFIRGQLASRNLRQGLLWRTFGHVTIIRAGSVPSTELMRRICCPSLPGGVWSLGIWGLGFGVWGLGFGVWGLGFGVQG